MGAAEALLAAALAACRDDVLEDALRSRPRLQRWLARRVLLPAAEAGGDMWIEGQAAACWKLTLRWAISRLRPDHGAMSAPISREAWLERTSWRPMLAILCHYGFSPVENFRERYHARVDESAADHLCGLWSVGQSTFYRYLDKGRRQLLEVIAGLAGDPAARMSLRMVVREDVQARLGQDPEKWALWHRTQAQRAQSRGLVFPSLLHCAWAGDTSLAVAVLKRHALQLANHADTTLLVEGLAGSALAPRQAFDLCLARAELCRISDQTDAEVRFYERAVKIGAAEDDPLMLGIAYSVLGKYHEPRDSDRAFACYQDGVEFLRKAGLDADDAASHEVLEAYATTLIRLAWLYLLRSDARSRAALEGVEHLRSRCELAGPTVGMLEQVWGEYWRRAGELRRALEHKHRALNLFERLGDQRSVLATCVNLSPIYAQLKDYDRAVLYAERVLELGSLLNIEPEMACSAHLNLGATYFWQARYAHAIEQYQQALQLAERTELKLHARRAHYNLAEAFYTRRREGGDATDEALGDAHAAAALKVWPDENDPTHVEATKALKGEILGNGGELDFDRLVPEEFAAHYAEMTHVRQYRTQLTVPAAPQVHIQAHLAIAKAYLSIAMKEREAARTLMRKHGLEDDFEEELSELRGTFNREMSREEALSAHWRSIAPDVVRDGAVLTHLLRIGSINKSGYAELCSVGLATASKHLGMLAERGLLIQVGKGPSTRYVLPGEAAGLGTQAACGQQPSQNGTGAAA